MKFSLPSVPPRESSKERRPRDDELDLFGVTHVGHTRPDNQDHFLLCTVHPQVVLHGTSLPEPEALALRGERLATIMLVADGVGGTTAGSTASRLATEAVTGYVSSSLRSYHTAGSATEEELTETLRAAACVAHDAVRAEAMAMPGNGTMATTLSLAVVIWPWLYVVQVGDSRCYLFRGGVLRQVTRDQTIAQELVDQGVLAADKAQSSPLSHVLSSAIGSADARPEITRVDVRGTGTVILVCTDGLTKHVADKEIAQHLERMRSSEEACQALLQLALDRGGTDNITLVVGQVLPRSGP